MSAPRKPARPSPPRGKIRVAGSGPATGKPTGDSVDETTTPVSMSKSPKLTKSPKSSTLTTSSSARSAAAGESATVDRSSPTAPPSESGFLTWRKVAVVAAIALVVGAFAVVASFKPWVSDDGSNLAFTNASATSELKAQAGDRICAVLSVDPTKFDDWANKAKTGLTGDALSEFNDYQTTTKDMAAQTGQGAECKVDMVAVSDMGKSTASVIVTLIISNTQQGVAVMSGSGLARAGLELQKQDGQWLISRISDF